MRRVACAVSPLALAFGLLGFACSTNDTAPATTVATPDAAPDARARRPGPPRVLFFTKETLFFHTDAHKLGDDLVPKYLRGRGHEVTVTNDAAIFTPEKLGDFDVALFFVTSGVVFDDAQRAAFEGFIKSGKGFAGVHAASATEVDSEFFRGLVGAVFNGHGPALSTSSVTVVDGGDSLVSYLPNPWMRRDEWYYFRDNPANNTALTQLLRIDESTLPADYPDGGRTGIHPLAWRQEYVGGRSFYTALGHTGESYQEELFVRSIALGVEWAAGVGAIR